MRRAAILAVLVLVSCTGETSETTTTAPALTTLPPATAPQTSTTTTTTTSTTTSTTTTTTLPPDAAAEFALTQVTFGDFAHVVVTNWGNDVGSLDGLWLSRGEAVQALPNLELTPGQQALLGLAADPPPDLAGIAITTHLGTDLGVFDQAGGELAIHDSDLVDEPESMIGYVAWGAGPHQRLEQAVHAGIWDGESVEIIDDSPSISTGIFPAYRAADWATDLGG